MVDTDVDADVNPRDPADLRAYTAPYAADRFVRILPRRPRSPGRVDRHRCTLERKP
jgi:hypothetical protein